MDTSLNSVNTQHDRFSHLGRVGVLVRMLRNDSRSCFRIGGLGIKQECFGYMLLELTWKEKNEKLFKDKLNAIHKPFCNYSYLFYQLRLEAFCLILLGMRISCRLVCRFEIDGGSTSFRCVIFTLLLS